jgi:light-regulated signal transduction histidine kinase (bacteriophytochrome)
MSELLSAFAQANCQLGYLVFNKNTEGDWVCAEANKCAESTLENANLVSRKWVDIFHNSAFDENYNSLTMCIDNRRWLSLTIMHGSNESTRVVILNDVTSQEQRIQALDNKIQQLKNSNKDLEHFAYVASHDLKEPLRKIVAFSERLHKKYASLLEGDGLVYLSRMIDATQRMQTFIDDLLMFSRFSRDTSEKTEVDLNEILRGVLSDLDMQIESTNAKIEYDSLPKIKGVKTQMTQLIQNLISNALKFKKQDISPAIKIKCTDFTTDYQIKISDNGIGFDEADAERIFVIFQRLNGRSEYEGTGIGLAICKKIVENHGGTISAQGQLNEGATFLFTLPKTA